MKDSKEVRLTFKETTYNTLHEYSEKLGVSITTVVRIAVQQFINKEGGNINGRC